MRSFDDFGLWNHLFKRLSLDKVSISAHSEDLRTLFQQNPKSVIAINHGPGMAPGIVNTALTDIILKNGGADRKPISVVWKHFYKVPVLKHMIRYMTQVNEAYSFDQFTEAFKEKGYTDLLVMPEGENCCFGNGMDIEPFLSPRFIEIAVRCNVPILIATHYGSHVLQRNVSISDDQMKYFKWLPEKNYVRLDEARRLSLPQFPKNQQPSICFSFELYQPTLKESDLSPIRSERMKQLWREANAVRERMQARVDEMREDNEPIFNRRSKKLNRSPLFRRKRAA